MDDVDGQTGDSIENQHVYRAIMYHAFILGFKKIYCAVNPLP